MQNFSSDKTFVQEDKFLNALAEAYRLQEAIISATELAIISVTPDGFITSFNKAAENLLGYHADEVIGRFTPVVFHDLDEIILRSEELTNELGITIEPGFDVFVAKARVKGIADRREWTYIHKNGSRFPAMLSVTALRDERDILIGYASIATDITDQKKIDQKIRESESHLHALVSSIDDIIYEIDEHGRFVNVWAKGNTPQFITEKKNIQRHSLSELFDKKLTRPSDAIIQEVLRTGDPQNYEFCSAIELEDRWFNAKYSLIYHEGKPTNRISVAIQDITIRKKAEVALKESEQKFRLLAENIPGIIYLCNHDKNFSMLYLNDKTLEITGYPKEDFLDGRIHITDLFHPDESSYIHATVNEKIAQKTSFHLKYRIRHRSGEWRWLEEHGIGVYSDNQLLWIEGFISDVTSRKEAEEELLRIADENYRVFNYSLGLNAIAGFDYYFKKLNPAWENLLGWTIEELLSRPYLEFIHPDDLKTTRRTVEDIRKGKKLSYLENRLRCKDGSYRWLLWTSSLDHKHEIIYASALDITERKRTEEELLQSKLNLETVAVQLQEQNRQLDEFAHIISHNLRGPVGNIKALISFLHDNSSIDDYKLIFDKLKKVSNNLNETMNELMDTMQVKKNTQIEKVELRFKDILDKVVQSLEGDLIQCGASVTYDFNNAPRIEYVKTYLESIFQNMLSNAIKYRSHDRPPVVHFGTTVLNNKVELRVSDNGLGIDMEKYGAKLFGLHKTFHENKEARGVGLFLTKTQIETLGGSIAAESEVGRGTTFIIRF